ncbi:MAG: YibE/F family protein [Lactobacillaceae bacterium]|nr:YibE/F family protein [Lactobacillaceae bacterium]
MNRNNQVKKMVAVIIVSILSFLVADNDAIFYKQPVGLVTAVKTVDKQEQKDEFENSDITFTQQLTVHLQNKSKKTIHLTNDVVGSQLLSEKYSVGQKLLLQNYQGEYSIYSLKRDQIIAPLVVLTLSFIIIFVDFKKYLFILLSLTVNAVLYFVFVIFDVSSGRFNVIIGSLVLAILSTLVTFGLIIGFKKSSVIAIVSTIAASLVSVLIAFVSIYLTGNNGVHFENSEFVTQPPTTLFFAQMIISVLGAVMDETSDITAAIFTISEENQNSTFASLFKHGMSAGKEIMGTLINVLFMIFIGELIPMFLVYLRDGNEWSYIFDQVLNLGILQTITAGIGIVIAVPITSYLSAISKKKVRS